MNLPAFSIGRVDREPIAIVGIGCRFPGASDPTAFWRLLADGVDAIREIPRDRFDIDALYDERPAQPGKMNTRWGGFVDGLDLFDAEFFGISPREAERLDPQQRLLLETSWEAIEDAGIVPARLMGSATGVFVGMWINEYESRLFRNPDAIDFYMTTGSGRYAASGRLSYHYGLQGPSLTLDTGCSSSLVAVHLACQSLWNGESELALAGAANAIVEPFVTIAYSQSGMMAPDGRCKFGDARANGYVRSDGAAMVILKPLSKAIADGNPVYATILGSAVTNDGRGSGFMTTPAREGQEEMLRRAYRDAGISPGLVQYVEAHGTGTRAGDPVELGALGAVLAAGRSPESPCRVGSVKTNIGHTEGAAGLAGLIKAALCLKHRTIPANLHFQSPNPEIPWDLLPLVIPQRTEPWPATETAVAGVSSFGISGTNAHVVLAEPSRHDVAAAAERPTLLTISGHSQEALRAMVAAWRDVIAGQPSAGLVDTCYCAAGRRAHHTHRAAFAAATYEQVLDHLDGFAAGEPREGAAAGAALPQPKVAFVFPGQGSQWTGMGRRLYDTEAAFRSALDECAAAISVETGWSVVDVLMGNDGAPTLDHIDVIQPALFAVQVSLAALWTSWGIRADAVVGHSMGEVAAAYVSGALSLRDAARVICLRSRLMKRTSGHGAMAVVELAGSDAVAEIREHGALLSVAVCNSSRSSVLSGDPAALDAVLAALEARGVFCRRVKVDVASHSPQMDPLCEELFDGLASIRPSAGSTAFYSTAVPDRSDKLLTPDYWVKNLRHAVMFGDAVQRMARDGYAVFIEMSPHPILTGAVREGIADAGANAVAIGSTRRDEDERLSIMASLGAAYTAGVDIDWRTVFPNSTRTVPVPRYAFQRERFWFEAEERRGPVRAMRGLLGPAIRMADRSHTTALESELTRTAFPWLFEHRIHGLAVVPASLFVELACQAATASLNAEAVILSSIQFESARYLADQEDQIALQVLVRHPDERSGTFEIYSRVESNWVLHVTGELHADAVAGPIASTTESLGTQESSDGMYRDLEARGVGIGPLLRSVASLRSSDAVLAATLRLPAGVSRTPSGFRFHPAVLDGAFQLTAALPWQRDGLRMPTGITEVRSRRVQDGDVSVTLTRSDQSMSGVDVVVTRPSDGAVVFECRGLMLADPLATHARPQTLSTSCYQVRWQQQPLARAAAGPHQFVIAARRQPIVEALVQELGTERTWVVELQGDEADATRIVEAIAARGADAVAFIAPAVDEDIDPTRACDLVSDVVRLAQAMGRERRPAKLWLVTQSAQPVVSADDVSGVEQSALWGLASALGEERPDIYAGIVDIDRTLSIAESAKALAAELRSAGSQVALRAEGRFVPSLVKASVDSWPAAPSLRADAAYLITGGLGDLGLEAARLLVARGARRLILAGRTPLPPRQTWGALTDADPALSRVEAVLALERLGAVVDHVSLDVAHEAAVRLWLDGYRAERRPDIRGIVHCAGVLAPALLDDLTPASVRTVFHSKVGGPTTLSRLFDPTALDFFVLYSSISSRLAVPGQANYAAANAFLSSFSAYLRLRGTRAMSLEWGAWDIGMAASLGEAEQLSTRGLGKVGRQLGQAALAMSLGAPGDHSMIVPIDLEVWRDRAGNVGPTATLLQTLIAESTAAAAPIQAAALSWADAILALPGLSERRDLLETFVLTEVAHVLKRPSHRIALDRPLRAMGLDSLMSLELRNRFECATALKLPATLAWNHPTVAALAAFLGDRMGVFTLPEIASAAGENGDSAIDAELAELLGEIEALPEEEMRRLLSEEL